MLRLLLLLLRNHLRKQLCLCLCQAGVLHKQLHELRVSKRVAHRRLVRGAATHSHGGHACTAAARRGRESRRQLPPRGGSCVLSCPRGCRR